MEYNYLDQTIISWNPPLQPGGSFVRYNAVRSSSRSDFTTNGLCVYSDGLGTIVMDPDPVPEGVQQ